MAWLWRSQWGETASSRPARHGGLINDPTGCTGAAMPRARRSATNQSCSPLIGIRWGRTRAHDQVGRQDELPIGALVATQPGNHAVNREAGQSTCILPDGGEARERQTRLAAVIISNDRYVARNGYAGRVSASHKPAAQSSS